MTIQIIDFKNNGDGVVALYINGVLRVYGDEYHNKISFYIRGFTEGVMEFEDGIIIENIKITDEDLNSSISDDGDSPPNKYEDLEEMLKDK